jgi:hypothetical protein
MDCDIELYCAFFGVMICVIARIRAFPVFLDQVTIYEPPIPFSCCS